MHLTSNQPKNQVDFDSFLGENELSKLSSLQIFNLANKLRRANQNYSTKNGVPLQTKRIAIIASLSSQHLINILNLFLHNEKIKPIIYEANYNGLFTEALDPNSELYKFQPDFVFIVNDHRDIKNYPALFCNDDERKKFVTNTAGTYQHLWQTIHKNIPSCQIFQSLYVAPLERQLGGLESNYIFSKQSLLKQINLELIQSRPSGVMLLDFDYFASKIGKEKWFDEPGYYVSKQPFSIDGMVEVTKYISRVVSSYFGSVKKCLVLDLDNTLWGGVIGDDGLDGIVLDPNHSLGETFINFQKYLKSLKERGVLLAICSKNQNEIAMEVFEKHEFMVLKKEDFVSIQCNWENKDRNIVKIAKDLNLGLDSFVFFDDNPIERGLVSQSLPEVQVIDVPKDPALYIKFLDQSLAFEWAQLSRDDLIRSENYVASGKREEFLSHAIDFGTYLKSLELEANVGRITAATLPRFTQLLNKSNQFNLRTQRYTEAEIKGLADSDKYSLFYVNLKDRFTEYGIISCIIINKIDDHKWFIESWVMSCRALKLGVEELVLNTICKWLKEAGAKEVIGEYIETKKNGLVKDLLPRLGFQKLNSAGNDRSGEVFGLKLIDFSNKQHYIQTKD